MARFGDITLPDCTSSTCSSEADLTYGRPAEHLPFSHLIIATATESGREAQVLEQTIQKLVAFRCERVGLVFSPSVESRVSVQPPSDGDRGGSVETT